MTKAIDNFRRDAAPPITRSNLILKLRRIRWELSITMQRTRDLPLMGEMKILVAQTDEAIERMEARRGRS